MKRLLCFILTTAGAIADPKYHIVRVDAQGLCVESVQTSTPTTESVGPCAAGEHVEVHPWADLGVQLRAADPDAGKPGAIAAPLLRVTLGHLGVRPISDIDRERAAKRKSSRIQALRRAASDLASQVSADPDDADLQAQLYAAKLELVAAKAAK